jgi:hypothetical protein
MLGPAVIEEGKAHAAALRDHRHLTAPVALRQERDRACFHHRAEGRAQRRRGVGEAFCVRTAHRHVVAPGDGADFVLQRPAGAAGLLGEARAQNRGRPNAGGAAAFELLRHELRRDDQHGEVGGCRQRLDRAKGRETLHHGFAAAHRVDRSDERMAPHDLQDAPAQALGVGRCADDSHRAGPEQFSYIGHVSRVPSRFSAGRGRGQ